MAPLSRPVTSTGAPLSVVEPFPSSPRSLLPQHLTPPPLVSAQVWRLSAEIALTPLARPETSTRKRLSVIVALPSWPKRLRPQHLTPPPLVSAQVWRLPAAIAMTPVVRPATSSG